MQKIKPLKPNMRIKKRYIKFVLNSESPISLKDSSSAFKNQVLKFIGEYGLSMSGFQILKESNNNNIFVKTNSKYLNLIKTSAALVEKINDVPVKIQSEKTSGILKNIIEG